MGTIVLRMLLSLAATAGLAWMNLPVWTFFTPIVIDLSAAYVLNYLRQRRDNYNKDLVKAEIILDTSGISSKAARHRSKGFAKDLKSLGFYVTKRSNGKILFEGKSSLFAMHRDEVLLSIANIESNSKEFTCNTSNAYIPKDSIFRDVSKSQLGSSSCQYGGSYAPNLSTFKDNLKLDEQAEAAIPKSSTDGSNKGVFKWVSSYTPASDEVDCFISKSVNQAKTEGLDQLLENLRVEDLSKPLTDVRKLIPNPTRLEDLSEGEIGYVSKWAFVRNRQDRKVYMDKSTILVPAQTSTGPIEVTRKGGRLHIDNLGFDPDLVKSVTDRYEEVVQAVQITL